MVEAVDDVDSGEVDGVAHLGGGAADRHDRLGEAEAQHVGDRGVEQRCASELEQLLGLPESLRRSGGDDEGGGPQARFGRHGADCTELA